jgi:hypothetical protein
MNRLGSIVALLLAAGAGLPAFAQFTPVYETVAITEFLTRPIGERDGRDFVELFNFGDQAIDLKGFQLSDDANKLCEIPAVTIQPRDFVIVVLGHDWRRPAEERKKIFEAEWFGGKSDPRVVAVENGNYLLGAADTLILKNRRKTPIWILGYTSDDKPGTSTYLVAADDNAFKVRMYGTKEKPSINRAGPDGSVIGYEGQDTKKEDVAWTSDVSKLEEVGGYLYRTTDGGKVQPSLGSPLKGNYPGVKK